MKVKKKLFNKIHFKLKIWLIIFLIIFIDIGISLYIFKKPSQNTTINENQISSDKPSSIENHMWTILITGDVIPARSVNFLMTQKNDFMWPLNGIKKVLQNADLTLINLESSLIANCPLTNEGMIFCGDTRFAQSLKDSGVDVVNLSNNHSLNYGWEGLGETEKLLNNLSIDIVGYTDSNFSSDSSSFVIPAASSVIPAEAGILNKISDQSLPRTGYGVRDDNIICQRNIFCSKASIKTVRGIHVGFLGYNAVGQEIDRELVSQQIADLKQQVDVIVVSVHWGKEYTQLPEKEAEDPKELGRWFIDNGANIIVGNHPHVIQPYEFYKTGIIFYALGNTVFDQEWSPETKKGNLVKLYFDGKKLLNNKMEIIPIGIRNYGEAYLLNK